MKDIEAKIIQDAKQHKPTRAQVDAIMDGWSTEKRAAWHRMGRQLCAGCGAPMEPYKHVICETTYYSELFGYVMCPCGQGHVTPRPTLPIIDPAWSGSNEDGSERAATVPLDTTGTATYGEQDHPIDVVAGAEVPTYACGISQVARDIKAAEGNDVRCYVWADPKPVGYFRFTAWINKGEYIHTSGAIDTSAWTEPQLLGRADSVISARPVSEPEARRLCGMEPLPCSPSSPSSSPSSPEPSSPSSASPPRTAIGCRDGRTEPSALRWGCRVVRMPDSRYDLQPPSGDRYWCSNSWDPYTDRTRTYGVFATEADALATLNRVGTKAPPDYVEQDPEPFCEATGGFGTVAMYPKPKPGETVTVRVVPREEARHTEAAAEQLFLAECALDTAKRCLARGANHPKLLAELREMVEAGYKAIDEVEKATQ